MVHEKTVCTPLINVVRSQLKETDNQLRLEMHLV